jgi:UDP-glucose 4-epimerase
LHAAAEEHVGMIILIGGNGFLGRHLCELLERRGEPAWVVSRSPDKLFLERFAPSLRAMSTDEFALEAGQQALAQARAIVYLAWRSVPATFASEPWREIPENVQPSLEFFARAASVAPKAKIVFLSSGGTIYGRDGEEPKIETSPTNPISSYGLGKLMTEEALRFVGRSCSTPYAILRVSNAIGRWQRSEAQGIVGAALRAVHDGVPLSLFGGGTQVRDFVDANDVADAVYAACLDTRRDAATWNIGSGVGLSVAEVLQKVSSVINQPVPVEQAAARSLDVPHIVLNCQKAAKELEWRARIPIERSILDLWETLYSGSGRDS